MRNVEMKAWLRDREDVERIVAVMADGPATLIEQDDTFYGMALGRLKLRRLSPNHGELISYQRPDSTGPRTSTYEISVTQDPDSLDRVLRSAYQITGRVIKERTLYMVGRTRVHLDRVQGLGDLMELEVVLEDQENGEDGFEEALRIMRELGIENRDLLALAYADLIAEGATAPRLDQP